MIVLFLLAKIKSNLQQQKIINSLQRLNIATNFKKFQVNNFKFKTLQKKIILRKKIDF